MQEIEVPVLIVGGSLVGLSAGLLLARHGVRALVVERHPGTAIHPRAAHATQRTMEILRSVGLETAIRERSAQQFVQHGGVVEVETLVGGAVHRLTPGCAACDDRRRRSTRQAQRYRGEMTEHERPAGAAAAPRDPADANSEEAFSPQDVETIEDNARLRAPMIYEIVRREGEEEMRRPAVSLWWSGVAAGLSISFSLLTEAMLQMHLPDAPWRELVSSLGYPVGFLMVVLARQQLFTENTIRAVLPLAASFTAANLASLARMWGIVFAANLAGTLISAAFCSFTPVITPDLRAHMLDVSRLMMENGWAAMFFKGIAAGFLIAAMVWLIPNAEAARFHVVTLMTYLIALGGFAHVVAGSVEAFMLVLDGQLGVGRMLGGFTIPVLLGNIVGGTALFAVISYAQIMKEL